MLVFLLVESKALHDFLKLAIVTIDRMGTKLHGKSKVDLLREIEAYVDCRFDKNQERI